MFCFTFYLNLFMLKICICCGFSLEMIAFRIDISYTER